MLFPILQFCKSLISSLSKGDSSTISKPSSSSSDSFFNVGQRLQRFLKAKFKFLHLKQTQSPGLSEKMDLDFSLFSRFISVIKVELEAFLGPLVELFKFVSIGSNVITASLIVFSLLHRLHLFLSFL